MDITEIKLLIADVIEGIAATDRRLSSLTSSVTAMRLALAEVSPERFETSYARHYEDAGLQMQRMSDDLGVRSLLALAENLRQSS